MCCLNDSNGIWTHTHLARKPFSQTGQIIELCCEYLSVRCFCHVAFQSEPTLYNSLNIKELLARKNHDIWSLRENNRIWTHNYIVRKQTFKHLRELVKWLSYVVSTYLYGAFDCMLLSCDVFVSEWIYTL